jgi:hypothetical protein
MEAVVDITVTKKNGYTFYDRMKNPLIEFTEECIKINGKIYYYRDSIAYFEAIAE